MNAQDRFEIYQATPKTKTPCMTAGPPVPIPHPPSQRKKTPPSVSEQGFPKGGAQPPFGRFKEGVRGKITGFPPQRILRWEKEEQRNE